MKKITKGFLAFAVVLLFSIGAITALLIASKDNSNDNSKDSSLTEFTEKIKPDNMGKELIENIL